MGLSLELNQSGSINAVTLEVDRAYLDLHNRMGDLCQDELVGYETLVPDGSGNPPDQFRDQVERVNFAVTPVVAGVYRDMQVMQASFAKLIKVGPVEVVTIAVDQQTSPRQGPPCLADPVEDGSIGKRFVIGGEDQIASKADFGEITKDHLPMLRSHPLVLAETIARNIRAVVAPPVAVGVGLNFDPRNRSGENHLGRRAVGPGGENISTDVHQGTVRNPPRRNEPGAEPTGSR